MAVNKKCLNACIYRKSAHLGEIWRNSSDAAVNQLVVGSIPTAGANKIIHLY